MGGPIDAKMWKEIRERIEEDSKKDLVESIKIRMGVPKEYDIRDFVEELVDRFIGGKIPEK